MTPTLIPVTSSNLLAVGYDPAAATLYVAFRPSPKRPAPALYAYEGVPAPIHAALLAAPSAGAYLCSTIKGAYPYCRLPDLTEDDSPFAAVEAAVAAVEAL